SGGGGDGRGRNRRRRSGPVAGLTEGVAVVEASDGSVLGEAMVADEGAEVAAGEGVGGVDEGVAGEAEAGGVRLAVDEATLGTTQLAQRLH
ncbi:unnamed protein product, partial [Musa acuminata subsp. malaccensis]